MGRPQRGSRVERSEYTQKLYSGFGNTLAQAIEFVATPTIFALFGHWLDARLHTGSVLLVGFATFGLVGVFLRTWFAYVNAMKAEEGKGPWSR